MKARRIGVVMGGKSAERDVSFATGKAVAHALEQAGRSVARIELGLETDAIAALKTADVDAVFIALHGRFGEDGCIQGVCEMLGVPYTGSGVLASALAMDKLKSKELFRLHNVPTPPYYVYDRSTLDDIEEVHGSFGYPAIVKPRREGSSVGIARVNDAFELAAAVEQARAFDHDVLVERFITGKEISVGVLDGRVLGAIEIAPKKGIYDYESKYTPGMTEYFMPARLTPTRYRGVLNIAERAVRALDARGAVRVDLIATEGQNEYVLEINTLPGMTPTSLLPKIAAAAGFGFVELCEAIIDRASLAGASKPRLAAIAIEPPSEDDLAVAV